MLNYNKLPLIYKISDSNSSPKLSSKGCSIWIVVILFTGEKKTAPCLCLASGPCPNCGQVGHWRNDCPFLLFQGIPVSQVPHSQESSGSGSQRLTLLCLAGKEFILSCVTAEDWRHSIHLDYWDCWGWA